MPSPFSQRARKALLALASGGLVGLLAAAGAWVRPGPLEGGERWTYDLRVRRAVDAQPPSGEIVIVDVGEGDLQRVADELGESWPWPRELFGYLVGYATRGGARVVALDWLFQDRGRSAADADSFAEYLRATGKAVVGMAMPKSLPARSAPEPGPWVLPFQRYHNRAEALRGALAVQSWNVRTFLVPAPTEDLPSAHQVLVGGRASAEEAAHDWQRLAGAHDFLAAGPQVRQLSDAERAAEVRIEDLLAERDGVALSAPGIRFPERALMPPLPALAAGAARAGNVLQEPDVDGIFRRHQLLVAHGGRLYPSLPLAAFLVANPQARLGFDGGTLTAGERRIPLDPEGRMPLRFVRSERYGRVSAWQVLRSQAQYDQGDEPELPLGFFKDKYVIISASAYALGDFSTSPVKDVHLGAEINANALDNLITGRSVRRAAPALDALFALLLAVATALALLALWTMTPTAGGALAGMGLALGLSLTGAWWLTSGLLEREGLWLALTTPALGAVGAALATVLAVTFSERRDRRFVQDALGRYTSPVLVRELMAHPEYLSLEWGEVREISVFFSDIAGFTDFSEQLKPEKLVALLNDYLTNMTDIVLEHGGVVDKYIGDAVMAFWGAPLPEPEHAQKAVLAALAMRRRCEELRPKWQAEYGPTVIARAGINSGLAVSGNMGSRHKYNYTVMGDTVNLASRLEGANKPYGTTLMISESCFAKVREVIEARELDLLAVKGKKSSVRVYEVLSEKGRLEPEVQAAVAAFHEGLALYRDRHFVAALAAFDRALGIRPDDGPSKTYVERCKHFVESPPEAGWDGVWRMKEK